MVAKERSYKMPLSKNALRTVESRRERKWGVFSKILIGYLKDGIDKSCGIDCTTSVTECPIPEMQGMKSTIAIAKLGKEEPEGSRPAYVSVLHADLLFAPPQPREIIPQVTERPPFAEIHNSIRQFTHFMLYVEDGPMFLIQDAREAAEKFCSMIEEAIDGMAHDR